MNFKGEIELDHILQTGIDSFNLIDVRSPSEYTEDHIPGSVNIPILDDDARKIVGTLYKQESPDTARMKAVELVSPILPDFIKQIHQINQNNKYSVLYCWRGGMRSEASITFARLAGITVSKLKFGYKSFRRHIMGYMESFDQAPHQFITLYGHTGTGKTELLEHLNQQQIPILNLEKAAEHKGSSFGNINEPGYPSITQRKFESRLWEALHNSKTTSIFTEGESKKIGKVSIPKHLFYKMTHGTSVILNLPMAYRVQYTIDTYKPEIFASEIKNSLVNIQRFIGKSKTEDLLALLDKNDFETFTHQLLSEYYDPLYKKSFPKKPDYVLTCDNISHAKTELKKIYDIENP